MAFRLTEADLYGALERAVQEAGGGLSLADSGGIVHLAFDAPAGELGTKLIRRHYDRSSWQRKTA